VQLDQEYGEDLFTTTPVQHAHLLLYIAAGFSIDIITLPSNQGIVKALNAGLKWLQQKKGFEFVARLDCGGVCDKNRFYRQVHFMRRHPDIDLTGSWCLFKDFNTGYSTSLLINIIL
jgi:glycosyltransferase involved in cell wall biosynthesis